MRPRSRAVPLGLLIPSTNTVAEDELNAMRPSTVSLHASRVGVGTAEMDTAEAVARLVDAVDTALPPAARLLRDIEPRRVIHVMSAHSFRDGLDATSETSARLEMLCGCPVTDGPRAFLAALDTLDVSRVALLTPYHDTVEAAVVKVLNAVGIEVVASTSLRARSTRSVASTPRSSIVDAVTTLAGSAPEAIVHIGGNLPFAQLAAALEQSLDLPVLAANTTMLWHALRNEGFADRIPGWGCLLEDH